MQYDASTPDEYMKMLEDDWRREKLVEIRNLLHEKAPNLDEKIQYKMLAYGDDKGTVFQLNAQKNYVALYVGDASKVDPTRELLEGIDAGKGCLRFKKKTVVADTRIDEFIEKTVQMWAEGADISC